MFSIAKNYARIQGKWSVKYCRDTLLSGCLHGENRFSVFYGEPEYDLHSDLVDDQRLGIHQPQKRVSGILDIRGQSGRSACGVFYWMLDGSKKQYFYDLKLDFIEESLAKIELVPAERSERYYRRLSVDTNQKIKRGMKDHIIGLIKVNNERSQMWGATTSIDLEGTKDRFVSLPYFIANRIEEEAKSWIGHKIDCGKDFAERHRGKIKVVLAVTGIIGCIASLIGVYLAWP